MVYKCESEKKMHFQISPFSETLTVRRFWSGENVFVKDASHISSVTFVAMIQHGIRSNLSVTPHSLQDKRKILIAQ